MASAARKPAKRTSDTWIILIGLFKLTKALGLLIIGIGLLRLMHRDVAAVTMHWIERFRIDPENRHIHGALARIFRVTPRQLEELSAGTFIYASIFLTEGIGLLMRKHWAEYLTAVSTSLFIPLEVYELVHRFTPIRLIVLLLNIATVWYLVVRIRHRK